MITCAATNYEGTSDSILYFYIHLHWDIGSSKSCSVTINCILATCQEKEVTFVTLGKVLIKGSRLWWHDIESPIEPLHTTYVKSCVNHNLMFVELHLVSAGLVAYDKKEVVLIYGKNALSGSRTRVSCLEGKNDNRYTNNAWIVFGGIRQVWLLKKLDLNLRYTTHFRQVAAGQTS